MILYYMFDDHDDLRRGAVECICNLVLSEDVCIILFVLDYL